MWFNLLRSSGEFDEDVVVFDLYGEDGDVFVRRVLGEAGFEMEDPGVPGTDDGVALDPSLAERTLAVGAEVVEGGEFAVEVGEADADALGLGFDYFAGLGGFWYGADFYPFRQMICLLRLELIWKYSRMKSVPQRLKPQVQKLNLRHG